MYKLFVIAKNNMKKQKGDMITLFILALLSAFLIFSSVSVLVDMNKVMDSALEKINGADVMLMTGTSDEENAAAEKSFRKENPADYETAEIYFTMADYRNTKKTDGSSNEFILADYTKEQRLQHIDFPENLSENDIILPYQLKGSFAVGDSIELSLENNAYVFHVAGYAEDPYYSVVLNINIYYVYISGEAAEKIAAENTGVKRYAMHMAKWDKDTFTDDFTTNDMESRVTDAYKNEISPYLEEHPEYIDYMALNWNTMRGGAQITPMLVMAILLVFAVIILLITIVIISFSVKNFIQRNMKNTGILEAAGYTIREIRSATITEIGIVSGIGTLIGLLLGALGSGFVGSIISSMIGISWNRPVNIPVMLLTAVMTWGIILLVTFFISRRYKKVTVLDALRGGMTNHNFRKNRFTFEKTRLPIPGVLSLKETFGNPGRSIALILIVTILTVCTAMGFGLRETFGTDKEKMLKIFSFEMSDIAISADEEIGDALRSMEGVEHVVSFIGFEPTVKAGNKEQTVYTYAYENVSDRQYMSLLEGRVPEHDNEAMITPGAADDLNVDIGDMITISHGTRSAEYIITGIEQKMERMGRLITLNYDGAEKIIPGRFAINYYVDGADGEDFESLKAKIDTLRTQVAPDQEWIYADINAIANESAAGIISAMKAVCLLLLLVTIVIIIFVESLVIRSRLVKEWKNMGVSRAVGMTYKQLRSQIMFSNMPAVLLGSLIGILISGAFGRFAIKIMFSLFGFRKIDFDIAPIWLLVTMVLIFVVAAGSAGFFGRKVKKLQPALLITEE